MRVAVTGGAGQLGRALVKVLGIEHDVHAWSRLDLDVTDADATMERVMELRPDAVIHAASWTDVDGCEKDPAKARRIHVDGTQNLAMAARKAQAHLVAVSTDMVFDGQSKRPYVESDATNPIQVYGSTKLEAEMRALDTAPRCTVVRTAWLYDLAAPQGFIAAVLSLAAKGEPFPVVADQIGSPTTTAWCAARLGEIVETRTMGVLHRAEPLVASRADFARRILEVRGFDPAIVVDAALEDLPPRPAKRPKFTPLASIRGLVDASSGHGDGCDC